MTITLPETLEKEVASAVKAHGYASEESFIEDALKHRLLLLKKDTFLAGARTVREAMERKGLTEKDIDDAVHIDLRQQIQRGAVERADRDRGLAGDWLLLENEL